MDPVAHKWMPLAFIISTCFAVKGAFLKTKHFKYGLAGIVFKICCTDSGVQSNPIESIFNLGRLSSKGTQAIQTFNVTPQ